MITRRDHGDGGIDERGPDRWRLRWRVGDKRYSKAFHGTKREAQTELRRLLKSADDGQHVAPDRMTLAAWSEQWFALLERGGDHRRGLVNAATVERYRSNMRVNILPTLGARPLQAITATEIDGLYARLSQRLSANSLCLVHAVLRGCLGAAVRKGLLLNNPVDRAEAPSKAVGHEVGQILDQEELATVLNRFRGLPLYPLVATAAFTGARRNELLALRWVDVELPARTITIKRSLEKTKAHGVRFKEPKTARGQRTIAIDENLAALLATEKNRHLRLTAGIADGDDVDLSLVRLPEGALVFPSLIGPMPDITRPRQQEAVTGDFENKARALGFPKLRFHDLRATHETLLLDAGVPVHVVAARCGHDAAMMLRVYAKRTKKADNSAAAIIGNLSKAVLG